jgi:epoxyqueuosine reductase
MRYLVDGRTERVDPARRMPNARTAMVLTVAHHHRRPPDPGGRTGIVARYAWGRDYHNLVGKRLRKLRATLREEGIASWGAVDTGPILERAWAQASGAGFTGKNTLIIRPGNTSWMFLAVLFIDAAVAPDPPLPDHCKACTRCLSACPTGAFVAERQLDARACISYWTIEARGLAPASLRRGFGRWVFGCDLCQEACPHNHNPDDPDEADLAPRHAWLDLDDVLATPDDLLMERFLGTPLRRPKAHGLKRNALVALGNLGDPDAIDGIRTHALRHDHPEVRAAAVWALGELGAPSLTDDPHPLVQRELTRLPRHSP